MSAYDLIHGPAATTHPISSGEIEDYILRAMDEIGPEHWHTFIRRPGVRHLIGALLSAQTHIEHYEDAARQRAIDAAVPKHQQQFANAMQKMMCPGSVPETMPGRARKVGL